MIRDVKLGIGRILIIDPLPKAWLVPDKGIQRIIQLVQASRARYDAVILLESAHYAVEFATTKTGYSLDAIPLPYRKMIRECGFIPVKADVHDEADYGASYWLLEFEGVGKTVKTRPTKTPPPFVVYENKRYVTVHKRDCRHVKKRRPTDSRYLEIHFLESVEGADKTVQYCQHCKPRNAEQ